MPVVFCCFFHTRDASYLGMTCYIRDCPGVRLHGRGLGSKGLGVRMSRGYELSVLIKGTTKVPFGNLSVGAQVPRNKSAWLTFVFTVGM